MLIGIVGFAGSGKDTVASFLIQHYGYVKDSWASPLKDAVADIFGWNRELLEGSTKESRIWREEVDNWWASRLNVPHLTPRWVLQQWGTQVGRNAFHQDIWIASFEKRFKNSNGKVVLTDCRFPNEIETIKNLGGKIVRVKRGPEPSWWDAAIDASGSIASGKEPDEMALSVLKSNNVHESEFMWTYVQPDILIENDLTLDDLLNKTHKIFA